MDDDSVSGLAGVPAEMAKIIWTTCVEVFYVRSLLIHAFLSGVIREDKLTVIVKSCLYIFVYQILETRFDN